MTPASWPDEVLALVSTTSELMIATTRRNGARRAATPIWVVRVGDDVYVRSWHRRTTGWFGDAIATPEARIGAGGLSADVLVEDVGADPSDLRAEVDDAYRAKYGAGSGSMVTDDAAATTLRLRPR